MRIDDKMIWKGSAEAQCARVLAFPAVFEKFVVGTHRSKSIELPVILLEAPTLGLRVWIRDNFHNWAVTIESEMPRVWDLSQMDVKGVFECYFEGFERAGIPVYELRDNLHNENSSQPKEEQRTLATSRQISFHAYGDALLRILEGLLPSEKAPQ